MQPLTIGDIIMNAIQIGLKNLVNLIAAVILWLVTIWIPYLNVGTTIGIYNLVLAMSRDEPFSPTEIFDPAYRKYMGEFFLLMGFVSFGVLMGYAFFIIPGLVIATAWSMAVFIMFDKNTTPLESIRLSNEITYGEKWTIFLGVMALVIVLYVAMLVLSWILGKIWSLLALLVILAGTVAIVSISLGAYAYIYRILSRRILQPPAVA